MSVTEWKQRCIAYIRSDRITPEHLEEVAAILLWSFEGVGKEMSIGLAHEIDPEAEVIEK